ncbi:MAG: exodeoxyribonuclease III, partial [Bacteroidota bacterium]
MARIVSYNVNGIRAAQKKGLLEWIKEEDPDVLCIQETKAQPEQLDDTLLKPEGYHAFFHSAEKKGYSGVAIYSKLAPKQVHSGIGIDRYDAEGRFLRVDYEKYSVISLYLPSGSSGEHRQAIKDDFLRDFLPYMQELIKEVPRIVLTGDFNICHKPVDIHDPVSNKKSSGFLPHEREWFTNFLELGFVDALRHFTEDGDLYTWWSYRARARERNKGWRIDYHLVTKP